MFRFTIRDVLWLTAVVGMAVGWWIDDGFLRRSLEVQVREQEKNVENALILLEQRRRVQQAANSPTMPSPGGFPGGSPFNGFPPPASVSHP